MRTLLVAVDYSEMTPAVVEQATRIASDGGAAILLLHVGAAEPDFMGHQLVRKVVAADEVPEHLRQAFDDLRELESQLRGRGLEVSSMLVQGKAVETILEEARRVEAEMIVLGSHKGGALYRMLGSTSEGVLRKAPCPVLVVPAADG